MRVGTPTFIGQRLREAREARGLTCQALADRLCVSRSSVSNYENDIQTPSPQVLHQLGRELNVPPHFFTRKIPPRSESSQFFRSLHSATKRARMIASRKYEWFREIVSFVQQFVKAPSLDLPDINVSNYESLSLNDSERIASDVRSHWRLGDRPISNIVWLLENKGFVCARFLFGSTAMDGFSEWRDARPFIILSSDKRCCVRSRYDAAHELAHMVLHRSIRSDQLADYSRFSLMEQQADAFAAAFLLPESTFGSEFVSSLDGLRELKRRWQVSIGAMIKRGRQLNLLSDLQEKNLWRGIGRRKWRTREPLDDLLPAEEPEFIRRSIQLLEKRRLSSILDIACQLALPQQEIIELCGIVDRMELPLLNDATEDRDVPDQDDMSIIPFRKRAEA